MSTIRHMHVRTRSVYLWTGFLFAVCAALLIPYVLEHGGRASLRLPHASLLVLLPAFYVHELLHVLGLRAFGGLPARDVAVRMNWRYLMLHLDVPVAVEARRLRWATRLPLVLLGLVPTLVGGVADWRLVYYFGIAMILGSGGDLAVLRAIRGVPAGTSVRLTAAWSDSGSPA